MALGKRIEAERLARGWSQQQLANEVNRGLPEDAKKLTQQALDRVEKRDSTTSEFACRIADALGLSIRWLLDEQGDRLAVDWPFPDRELLQPVLQLERDKLIEVQGAIRDKLAILLKHQTERAPQVSETVQRAA